MRRPLFRLKHPDYRWTWTIVCVSVCVCAFRRSTEDRDKVHLAIKKSQNEVDTVQLWTKGSQYIFLFYLNRSTLKAEFSFSHITKFIKYVWQNINLIFLVTVNKNIDEQKTLYLSHLSLTILNKKNFCSVLFIRICYSEIREAYFVSLLSKYVWINS